MNYACPYCACDLRRRKPVKTPPSQGKPGQPLSCPACGDALVLHPHPAEKLFFPGVLMAILGLNIYSGFSGIKLSMEGALIMLGLVFAGAYAVRHVIVPRAWSRYGRWKSELPK